MRPGVLLILTHAVPHRPLSPLLPLQSHRGGKHHPGRRGLCPLPFSSLLQGSVPSISIFRRSSLCTSSARSGSHPAPTARNVLRGTYRCRSTPQGPRPLYLVLPRREQALAANPATELHIHVPFLLSTDGGTSLGSHLALALTIGALRSPGSSSN